MHAITDMKRGALVTAAVVTVVIGTVILGQIIANARADEESAGTGQAERAAVAEAAHLFWDNPFQRMVFRAYGMHAIATGGPDQCGAAEAGPLFEVTAYTLFGIELDTIHCGDPSGLGGD